MSRNVVKKRKYGFTLIEVIVAVFVVALIVVGVFSLVQSTIVYRSFAVSQLQAAYLAQEGIELVRNRRDANWIRNPIPEWDVADLIANFGGEPPILLGGRQFDRSTAISDEGDYIEVTVTVSWQEKGETRSTEVITEMHNWYQ